MTGRRPIRAGGEEVRDSQEDEEDRQYGQGDVLPPRHGRASSNRGSGMCGVGERVAQAVCVKGIIDQDTAARCGEGQ